MRTLLDLCPADLRRWEWDFLHHQLGRWDSTVILTVTNLGKAELSADGRLLAVTAGELIQSLDFPSGQWRLNVPLAAAWNSPIALSPTAQHLATLAGETGILTVWNLASGEPVAEMKHGGPCQALA